MRWVRDSPCLVLLWVDNKVVSIITTVGNANEQGQVTRRVRTDGEWGQTQPQTFKTYNIKMNAVDRSDQILCAFSTISLILLWLTVLCCFRHIGLSIQRS